MSQNPPEVPDWVTSGPDADGNRSGPRLVPEGSPLDVQIAWMHPGEPMLWVDTALYNGEPLTCREAVEAAAGLLNGVLLSGGDL